MAQVWPALRELVVIGACPEDPRATAASAQEEAPYPGAAGTFLIGRNLCGDGFCFLFWF